jgi:type 2 lantibiotic biosynthesis protein LanM
MMNVPVDEDSLKDAQWYAALTLGERRRLDPTPTCPDDAELAASRLRHWRTSVSGFDDPFLFGLRLAADGLDEARLLCLLGMSPRSLRDKVGEAPGWLARLLDVYSRSRPPSDPAFEAERQRGPVGLTAVAFRPLLYDGLRRLQEQAAGILDNSAEGAANLEELAREWLETLLLDLALASSRTLVLELNVARVEGRLRGDTPEERFDWFREQLRAPGAVLRMLSEYPVLARQLLLLVDRWVEANLELLARFRDDRADLLAAFATQGDPGPLVAAEEIGGDPHRGRRTVRLLRFASGLRVVYKPRSVSLLAHFQQFLEWANGASPMIPQRILKVVDRGSYGWVEFIPQRECDTLDHLRRFYLRQGALLAILHVLGGVDFHRENIIAFGEFPVPVDVETLLSPRLYGDATEVALGDSVMAVGLLPHRYGDQGPSGADLSGIGGAPGQLVARRAAWESEGTDEMRYGVREDVLPAAQNLPSLAGEQFNPRDFVEEIDHGFTATCRILIEHREELLSEDGPLRQMIEDEARFVARPTRFYAEIFSDSLHPDALRDGMDRDRMLDSLWVSVATNPKLSRLVSAEKRDLAGGDIPLFTMVASSLDVWSSSGERISGFFAETGMDAARQRLVALEG